MPSASPAEIAAATSFTLVLVSRDRADRLARALAAIDRIATRHRVDLVVVDNGSTDATPATIGAFATTCRWPLRVLRVVDGGLAASQNAALRLAGGDIVVFTDDDCYCEPDLIDHYARVFADHRVAYAGGRVSLFDSADFPYTIQERAERLDIAPRSYLPAGLIMGANMAFRRSTLRAIGGFDPLLGPGGPCRSGADTDALVRSSAAGFAGVYDPGPVVLHHHGRKAGDIPALKLRCAFGRGATHVKAIAGSPLRMLYLAAWLKALCLPGERGWLERLVELRGAARYLALHRQARRERHAATGPARRPAAARESAADVAPTGSGISSTGRATG